MAFPSPLGVTMFRIFLEHPPSGLARHIHPPVGPYTYVPPSLKHLKGGAGILNLLSIAYAFRPRLRVRLTLGGFTLPRNP